MIEVVDGKLIVKEEFGILICGCGRDWVGIGTWTLLDNDIYVGKDVRNIIYYATSGDTDDTRGIARLAIEGRDENSRFGVLTPFEVCHNIAKFIPADKQKYSDEFPE